MSHLFTDATVAKEKNQGVSFSYADGSLFINFSDLVEAGENNRTFFMEACIITSRLENNAWKRSNSQMVMCTDDLADGGVDMETAIDSYSSVQFDTNSPWYLNKAGRGTTSEPAGVLQPGEVGFVVSQEGYRNLTYNDNGTIVPVTYPEGSSKRLMRIVSSEAFGMTVQEAFTNAKIETVPSTDYSGTSKPYADVLSLTIKFATIAS